MATGLKQTFNSGPTATLLDIISASAATVGSHSQGTGTISTAKSGIKQSSSSGNFSLRKHRSDEVPGGTRSPGRPADVRWPVHDKRISGPISPSKWDRHAAAVNFLRNISLHSTNALPSGERKHNLNTKSPGADKTARGRNPSHALNFVAGPSLRERQGWEEKLVDDQILDSQVWISHRNKPPFTLFSVLYCPGNEDKKRKDRTNFLLLKSGVRKRRRGIGGVLGQIGGGVWKGGGGSAANEREASRRGVSYAHLIDEETERYDPFFLCGNFKLKRHRAVMKIPGIVSSVVSYVKEKERRRELNELFQARHGDWLTTTKMSLSKCRKIKSLLLEIALDLDLEISTAALAYAYFERLVLRNVVSKYNRKVAAGAALLLAFKYNENLELAGEVTGFRTMRTKKKGRLEKLVDLVESKFHVKRNELLRTELGALVHLKFDLSVQPDTMLLLFEGMLAAAPYDDLGLPKAYADLSERERYGRPSVDSRIRGSHKLSATSGSNSHKGLPSQLNLGTQLLTVKEGESKDSKENISSI
eukprot:CAMPEP_0114517882 /NCGR_PEP_ID=MMETSP0109-20121206/18141_1 /TAXON_ID=29199 /ORGANISM="Chlorarachnion reptans, Strain CCCM449" /LENGTH=530 /DNA_ID=CAMNT_0001698453 /DNA_START=153 /DNA_END=1745 /DNA_ORIENTATION=+